jgi:stringent starvation protein B
MKMMPATYVCSEDRFVFNLKDKTIKKVQISKDDIIFSEKFS